MYYKLNANEFKIMQEVENKTCTDYDLTGNFVPVENLISSIEDLLYEIKSLEEKISDLENDVESNYKPRFENKYDEYGLNMKDFL